MTNLEQALIDTNQAIDEKDANEIVRAMVQRTKDFEDPEDILDEYFGEGDGWEEGWIDDILEWKQYRAGSQSDADPTPVPSKDEEKMMFKIKALLDKANSTDSQEEKDAFMMKAQELIQKNNLQFERIVAIKGTRTKDGVIVNEAILEEIVTYDDEWDRQLMQNIAEGNMCRVLFGHKKIHIIGKQSNCNSVLMLCDFYRKAIMNLAVEAAKRKSRISKTMLAMASGKKAINQTALAKIEKEEIDNIQDYLFGAVDGLKDALEKKNKIFEAEVFTSEGSESISGMQVMRVNKDKIAEYIREKYPNLGYRSFSGGGNSNSASYQRGHNDGGGLGSSTKRLS